MDATAQIALIVLAAVIVVALLIWFFMQQRRSRMLHDRFGDEYDRTVADVGKRGEAEANLIEREKRVKALDIRPFTASECHAFESEWLEVKALFVDGPAEATLHADRLLSKMMQTRGYPMADFDHRYEDLTVDHADVASHYREGHIIAERQNAGDATTEDLRQAMKHYEALFDRLVSDAEVEDGSRVTEVTARRT